METGNMLLTRFLVVLLIFSISTTLKEPGVHGLRLGQQTGAHALGLRPQTPKLQTSGRSQELNIDGGVFSSSEIYGIDYEGPRTHHTSSPHPYPKKGFGSSERGVNTKEQGVNTKVRTYLGNSGHG